MTTIYSIVSGKGGVGKTFFSINFSAALAKLGKKVLLVDTNLTTPNVSISLGVYDVAYTIHNVLKREIDIKEAIVSTDYGFDIIPASLSVKDLIDVNPENLSTDIIKLAGLYDYIILDSAASLGRETIAAIEASDKAIIITNPEQNALVDAYKAIKIIEIIGKDIEGVIVNKYKNGSYKISAIENYLTKDVIGVIRYDSKVPRSMEEKVPLVIAHKDSIAAKDIIDIAKRIVGVNVSYDKQKQHTNKKSSLIDKLKRILKIYR